MSREDRDKWDARYRAGGHVGVSPSPFLVSLANRLPRRGRALDVAGGAGRNALWLAARGLDVTIADVSEVGLAVARERAERAQLHVQTREVDLEEEFPEGPWDLVVCILYLQRSLFETFPRVLAPGGLLVFLQPTVINLERHAKPPRDFLLEPGEGRSLIQDLDILESDEGWSIDGFHEARILARKRVSSTAPVG
jgi:SAM-dependent methyltransferase